ncbi:hypothetical protein Pcinc_000494 [Petrolisthes cinctipes]|uniref:Uncharacterized protein n=1 Tax=Petrolisthes cinctipes TaxID=88211 RepID=A0AAE1L6I0_PETCI|nr:hypothetical protein Pcinc_000494 [Petrolisthes cinctipes]
MTTEELSCLKDPEDEYSCFPVTHDGQGDPREVRSQMHWAEVSEQSYYSITSVVPILSPMPAINFCPEKVNIPPLNVSLFGILRFDYYLRD